MLTKILKNTEILIIIPNKTKVIGIIMYLPNKTKWTSLLGHDNIIPDVSYSQCGLNQSS